jgi:hypothetical protein
MAWDLIAWFRLLGCHRSLAHAGPATLRREPSTAASPRRRVAAPPIPCSRTGLLERNFR